MQRTHIIACLIAVCRIIIPQAENKSEYNYPVYDDHNSLEADLCRLKRGDHSVHHSCLPFPVSSLERLLVAYSVSGDSAFVLYLLEIHGDTALAKDNGHVSKLFPSVPDNVSDLHFVVLFDTLAKVEGLQHKHSLIVSIISGLLAHD